MKTNQASRVKTEGLYLNTSIQYLKGVGPKIAGFLEKKGIKTIEDLFWFLPVRYVNKGVIKPISELAGGERASVVARVVASKSLFFRHSRKKAYEAVVDDGTGSISVKWFQWVREYLKKVCIKGNLLMLSGEVTRFGGNLQMVHPEIVILDNESEIEDFKGVTSIYSEIEGIKQGTLRTLIKKAFEDYGMFIGSVVPEKIEKSYGFVSLYEAFSKMHYPDEESTDVHSSGYPLADVTVHGLEVLNAESKTPFVEGNQKLFLKKYYERLVFEEYFLFQLALLIKRGELKKEKGVSFKTDGRYYRRFLKEAPFELTAAQKKVIKEIEHDMRQEAPMNRLLQGDVGSGKTICAVLASCMAIDNGYQAAFMAPTEILAEQHYLTTHKVFDGMGVSLAFLRGGMGNERKVILEGIKNGKIMVVVGTHALIQEDVVFHNLGLVIIDEQHRFGVIQRKCLKGKGFLELESRIANREKEGKKLNTQNSTLKTVFTPDTLVMTATPIPRTLSMVVYGDLDVSVIDEMPKGRQKVWTKVALDKDKTSAYKMVENELERGRQAYIVYPLVEESEKMELLSAKEMAAYLQSSVFPSYKVGLLHGRMKAEEKEEMMWRFKNREVDILVCTTVIEVGIDVPNATIIVVEHAERFGLSQLHQLRGRVGRGTHPSKCILITSAKRTALATKRLKAMEETTDGFKIAEEDMKMRGPGDMLGVRQAGLPDFRAGDIVKDVNIMIQARKAAGEAMETITADDLKRVEEKARERWKDKIYLSDVA